MRTPRGLILIAVVLTALIATGIAEAKHVSRSAHANLSSLAPPSSEPANTDHPQLRNLSLFLRGLTATVALAPEEKSVTLTGWAPSAPTVKTAKGKAGKVDYNATTQRFTVTVEKGRRDTLDGDPVNLVTLTLSVK